MSSVRRLETPSSFVDRLREIDRFFDGTSQVHQTMRRIAGRFAEAGIPYAIVGGMAVNAHGHHQTTGDVDVLLTRDGFAALVGRFVGEDFGRVPGRPRRFVDRDNGVTFDVLVTGLYPGSGRPGPIAYPDPAAVSEIIEGVSVVNLPTLIQLKLAAGRFGDLGDVVALLRARSLDELFQEKLHSSVRRDYLECLEEMRREDEYETRHDNFVRQIIPTGPTDSGGGRSSDVGRITS